MTGKMKQSYQILPYITKKQQKTKKKETINKVRKNFT